MTTKNKILFLTSRIPFPLEKGDKLRAYHQMRHLSKFNEVHLCVVSEAELTKEAETELKKFCKTVHVYQSKKISVLLNMFIAFLAGLPFQVGYFFNSGAHYFVKKVIKKVEPDHVFVQLIRMAEYVKDIKNISKSIDYMDSFSMGMERRKDRAKGLKKIVFHIENQRLKAYEKNVFKYFNHHFIISEQDRSSLKFENASKIEIAPNGVDTEFFTPDHSQEKKYDLLFTGNMSYPPNVAAVELIAKKILPIIWKKHPNCNFLIAGAEPNSKVKALTSLAEDKIKVTGWLDDIRTAYNSGKICLTPLNIGTGLQNKLLEAMSMELPCISSQLANNALAAQEGKEILIANTPEEYAAAVCDLLENETKRREIAINGKGFVLKNYHWESIIANMNEIISAK